MNQQQSRSKRGVILTTLGWQRLQEAQRNWENEKNFGVAYTIEALSDRPYEGINIKGVTGLTTAMIANLKALGAISL